MSCFLPAFHQRSEGAEIFDTAIGTGTEEDIVNLLAQQRLTRLEAHILHGFDERCFFHFAHAFRCRDMRSDGHAHTRIGSIGDHRLNVGCIEAHFLVEYGIVIALQGLPISYRLVPFLAFGCIFASFDVLESDFIRSDHTTTGTHFNRKVAECQSSFHSQAADGFAGIFHEITRSPAGGHFRHHVKRHVLGRYAFTQLAVDGNTHGLRPCLKNTLGSHDHFHFTGSDTERHSAHRAVSGSMGVPADNGHSRQSQSAFRTYHVDDSVPLVHHSEVSQPEIGRIFGQGIHLCFRNRILNGLILIVCRRVMVGHTVDTLRTETLQATGTHPGKSLRTGHFMTIKTVNI